MTITPEQQQAWQQYQQTSGFKPAVAGAASGSGTAYDAIDSLVNDKQNTYGNRVAANEKAGADIVGKGFENAGNDITNNFEQLKQNYATSPGLLDKVLHTLVFAGHTAGDIAGAAGGIIAGTTKAAASPFTQIQTAEGDTIGQRFSEPVKQRIQETIDNNPELIKSLTDMAEKHPEAAKSAGDLFNTLSLAGGDTFGGKLPSMGESAQAVKNAAGEVVDTAGAAKSAVTENVNSAASSMKNIGETIKQKAAAGKVPFVTGMSGQAKTSAERLVPTLPLQGAGAAIRPTPLQAYDQFAGQEAKHLGDIKEDPAISMVGERIGDAFDQVIKQRQDVGKTMGAELEKTATKPVDIKGAFGNFQSELIDNGAHYDAINGELVTGKASKFASDDKRILTKYASELQSLGKNPTMRQVDAFVSRMPKEIDGLKAERGITFNTNAERLIKSNLNDLRTALGKAGTKEYNAARTQYADLSKFIDEGSGFLGKKTQSGDFAKDASLAKSSVQSVLNNGKKDWLIELENKTGYPALDESTLALQAMQDAGDFKGESLLKLLSEDAIKGGTPHNAVVNAIIGIGKRVGEKTVFGTKAEQTRAYLKTLDEASRKQ